MSYDVHLISVRNALKPRREPYFGAPLAQGRYLGVRKLANSTRTWIARLRDDDGKQRYRAIGQETKAFDYDAAKAAAETWFADFDSGVTDKPLTVADACREYVADLEAEGRGAVAQGDRRKNPDALSGWGAAQDAEMRFKRTVYDEPIGKIRVEKLRTAHIKQWRNGLGGAKSSQNRNHTMLVAALNLAVTHRRVNPAVAEQWRAVKKHRNADNRRTLFLDLKQRRALLEACTGGLRDLVEAAMLTGSRPGELVRMKRSQFDARTASATFKGKSGTRTVPLSPAATAIFTRLAKGKLPAAPMFTRDDGAAWPPSGWDELLREAASKAKLPQGVVLYTLRHSFITEALRGGMATLDVARLTGTSLPMIQDHYGHLVAEAARERLAGVTML
ncbi:MAG: tyrosine-type recombinase/integrase [Lysobacterales bacterium]